MHYLNNVAEVVCKDFESVDIVRFLLISAYSEIKLFASEEVMNRVTDLQDEIIKLLEIRTSNKKGDLESGLDNLYTKNFIAALTKLIEAMQKDLLV